MRITEVNQIKEHFQLLIRQRPGASNIEFNLYFVSCNLNQVVSIVDLILTDLETFDFDIYDANGYFYDLYTDQDRSQFLIDNGLFTTLDSACRYFLERYPTYSTLI